jgi:RNA polymerase sigma-70 factor (sigma-E family)
MTPHDEQAFTEFVRERGSALLRLARLLVPDDREAEDLLQVALLRLSRHWDRNLAAPAAYVRTVLANLAKDHARRRHLVPTPADPDPDSGHRDTAPDHADAVAARAQLDHVLSSLPPRQRVTVVLRVVEGLSEVETAAVLGVAVGTVKSNLARGLEKARAALTPTPNPERTPR